MEHSVEARLPFQAVSLVEYFTAFGKYRFEKDYGKDYFRKYTNKNIDELVSRAKKNGMGTAIWHDLENFKN